MVLRENVYDLNPVKDGNYNKFNTSINLFAYLPLSKVIAKHIITVDAKDTHTDVQYSTIDTENV